ncbi:MAG: NAD-dependent epimerase/dehydratase family protein [Acidimicrobiales bacterium]
MSTHLIVGAGAIGRSAARHLSHAGHDVIVASRRGTAVPEASTARPVAADATDVDALCRLATGATAIINAVNPPQYSTWARDWPPVAAALIEAAARTGAGLVTVSNLYLYGPVDAPMTEETPIAPNGVKGKIRARMWADALAAHQAGRIRATEARASDYFGPGAGSHVSYLNEFVIAPAAAGRRAWLPLGGPDIPHSWTYVDDIGALAARLATGDDGWGRPWHVPTSPPRTTRQVAGDAAALAGAREPRLSTVPGPVMAIGRAAVPLLREFRETAHQFEHPYVLDSSAATAAFDLEPTQWSDALAATIAAQTGTAASAATAR